MSIIVAIDEHKTHYDYKYCLEDGSTLDPLITVKGITFKTSSNGFPTLAIGWLVSSKLD